MEAEVHVLHGLPRGAFDQVIDGGDNNGSACSGVLRDSDVAVVGMCDVLRLRELTFGQNPDERFIFVRAEV